jgi:hypothetical protein
VKALALGLRFVLELCLLAAVAYWGAGAGGSEVVHVVLAVAAPVALAVVWGLFVSPRARVRLPQLAWIVLQLALFGLGSAGLILAGQTVPGIVLLPAAFMNLALLIGLESSGSRAV